METVRVTITLPVDTKDELVQIADRSGVSWVAFLPVALVYGSRLLGRSLAPDKFGDAMLPFAIDVSDVEHVLRKDKK